MLARLLAIVTLGLALSGCVGVPAGQSDPGDPFEGTNRQIFAVNRELDAVFLARTAKTYNDYVPGFARERIHDLLVNLDLPLTFANDVLQLEPKRAAQTLVRLGVNATLGVGGLFDTATALGLPYHAEDFGQTLGAWGVGGNPYLVLPALGPSDPRDAGGLALDVTADPLNFVPFKQHVWWQAGREYMKILDLRARNLDTLADIERSSLDYYASTRSLYRQYRANEIRNGAPDTENLPEF
jgi:phospholipid-binding lipoprotein MlaA